MGRGIASDANGAYPMHGAQIGKLPVQKIQQLKENSKYRHHVGWFLEYNSQSEENELNWNDRKVGPKMDIEAFITNGYVPILNADGT